MARGCIQVRMGTPVEVARSGQPSRPAGRLDTHGGFVQNVALQHLALDPKLIAEYFIFSRNEKSILSSIR